MAVETEYSVRAEKTTKVVSSDPIDLVSVPCWTVTRLAGGMGWHIGKYESQEIADTVAAVLKTFSRFEVD